MTSLFPALLAAGLLLSVPAKADDTLKLAVGAPNNWDSGVPDIGKRAGIFQKHGLDLELLYTNGGGETMQAVISGSVDIGIGAGTGGVLGAFAKGAPVRILLAGATGASDLYWYVPAASPLKSLQRARRQDRGLFHQRRLDPHHAARAHQALQRHRKAGRDRRSGGDLDAGDVGPGRRRLGVAAVRARCARGRQNPPDRARQRRAVNARPDRARAHRQRQCAGAAPRR